MGNLDKALDPLADCDVRPATIGPHGMAQNGSMLVVLGNFLAPAQELINTLKELGYSCDMECDADGFYTHLYDIAIVWERRGDGWVLK